MLTRGLLSLVLCSLLACGGNTRAPVEDRYPQSRPSSTAYRVQRGDTLYSIAFRYGLDFRKVAAANNIPLPYTIYPGQKIYLKEVTLAAVKPVAAPAPGIPQSGKPVPAPAPSVPRSGKSTAAPAPVTRQPSQPAPVTRVSSSTAKKKTAVGSYDGGKVTAWRWPTQGRVTRSYSSSVHKGIDIGGKRGDAIQAVAAGKVVYAGAGIVGFGELLIVKHNDVYLSAYGHNDRLLVVEGQNVQVGQKIAEKGSTGTDTVKLHFEIRKEGKPIDPRRLLPRR